MEAAESPAAEVATEDGKPVADQEDLAGNPVVALAVLVGKPVVDLADLVGKPEVRLAVLAGKPVVAQVALVGNPVVDLVALDGRSVAAQEARAGSLVVGQVGGPVAVVPDLVDGPAVEATVAALGGWSSGTGGGWQAGGGGGHGGKAGGGAVGGVTKHVYIIKTLSMATEEHMLPTEEAQALTEMDMAAMVITVLLEAALLKASSSFGPMAPPPAGGHGSHGSGHGAAEAAEEALAGPLLSAITVVLAGRRVVRLVAGRRAVAAGMAATLVDGRLLVVTLEQAGNLEVERLQAVVAGGWW
ncbi:hypothetical protein MRX96_009790 [Rhipicephalus microplus]